MSPVKLRGHEIKVMRRIIKLTLAELAKKLDERSAAETVSRWESEAQPMGSYAEKLLRLIVCEELKQNALVSDITQLVSLACPSVTRGGLILTTKCRQSNCGSCR